MASVLPKAAAQGAPPNSSSGDPSSAAARKKKAPSAVTPQHRQVGVERHMAVDKNIVDELLLVCGVIGTTTETTSKGEQYLVPVTDCLNWLQDLQRALRRDEDMYRPISLLLCKWNVVQQKLLPLVLTCRYDTPMVLTIVKILVILTKPLNENTLRAGRLVIDTKSNKISEDVIEEQKKLRENALAQSDMLMEYKRAIVHHPSHRQTKSKDGEGGLLSIFVSLLAEPLSKSGTKRTDVDHLTIELVLHLFRNILCTEPILKGSQEASYKSVQLHNECISLFERELVLEILLVLCQDMELRENAQYNLLIMELLHHLLKSQDPTSVARCMLANNEKTGAGKPENSAAVTAKNKENNTNSNHAKGKLGNKTSAFAKPSAASNVTNGSLRSLLARDKQQFQTAAPARHGNFGGTLMLKRPNGKKQYVSASAMLSGSSQNASAAPLGGPKKRKTRKTDPFIGSGRTLLAHTRAGQTQNAHGGPSAIRAQKSLHRFCQRFLEKCYGPVMKSLKNEFRRESARLEGDEDKVVLFHIIWFFFQWYRVSGYGKVIQAKKKKAEDVAATAGESKDKEVEKKDDGSGTSALGQLIFTMDVFTFNLVLNATSTFTTHKNYTRLAQSVALYTEMMHMLNSMYHSKDETEQIMALGLMDRLFYGSDPVDRLPKLLSSWVPGTTTREYICDLSELCYVTLKLLDANKKACSGVLDSEDGHQLGENKKGKGKKKKPQTNDSVMQMKMTAADFDVQSYFVRKIVSNHVVYMYTKLLEQYAVNSAHVNHRIIAFFLRLAKVKVAVGEDDQHVQQALMDGEVAPPKNLLALKTSTLEPMLYNIHLLVILNRILNDPFIQKDKLYSDLLSWAVGIIHNFATFASSENPMLFVECLLKHPTPHRFPELSTNMYVNDELRMIAERELLLEEQRRAESMNAEQSDEESEEAEEELEFGDVDMGEPAKEKSKKRSSDDSDDSSGDDDDDKRKGKRQKIKFSQKRHQFKKLKKASNTEAQSSDSSDEEAELESNSAAKHSAATSEIADKSEKPKGSALVDSDDEDDNADSSSKSKSESDLKGTSNLKSKSLSDDDSSDEEAEFTNGASSPTKSSTAAVSKSLLEDSSDEEGPQASSICKESSASATKSKPAFDDDSSDEEGATTSLLKPGPQKSITKMQKAVLESNGHRDGLDEESEKEGGKGTEEAEIQDSKDLMDIDKSGNGLGQEDNDGEED